jgi:hypothetical protein
MLGCLVRLTLPRETRLHLARPAGGDSERYRQCRLTRGTSGQARHADVPVPEACGVDRGGSPMNAVDRTLPGPRLGKSHLRRWPMLDSWEKTVRTAAATMLRYPDKISDGLEAELYALLEALDSIPTAEQPESTR